MTRRPYFILAALMALMSIVSCASTPPKQAALQGENVLSAVRDLAKAYEARDLDAFMDKLSLDFPDRTGLEKSVAGVFSAYQTIAFKVHYTRALIEIKYQGKINATFTWEAEWRTAGGKTMKDGARGTFVYDPGTFKLLALEGKNPFLAQPGETPGKQ